MAEQNEEAMLGRESRDQGAGRWFFSTAGIAPAERNVAWAETMRRLRIPFDMPSDGSTLEGTVFSMDSPMGMEFSLIIAGPYVIAGTPSDPGDGLWLSVICEGEGRIRTGQIDSIVDRRTMMCGVAGEPATLIMLGRHKQVFVRIPRQVFGQRLLALPEQPLLLLDCTAGANRVFADMLESLAGEFSHLSMSDLVPFELSIVELLVAALAGSGARSLKGGAAGLRASLFEKVLQILETRLDDPDLGLSNLATGIGLTPRTLARLFNEQGLNFTGYVRERRLQRCYADLVSPLHSQLSITEIGFRWGFNSSAHFSRSFRERFNMSPREHRRSAAQPS